jgi:hypothetical protein
MDENYNCRICPSKCKWSDHSNLPYILEYSVKEEIKTSEELMNQY